MLRSATTQMLPPRPPSPPSGPPFGMNFSRRNDATPLPPLPAVTSMRASSMNFMVTKKPRAAGLPAAPRGASLQRVDADGAAIARPLDRELHPAVDQREQGVVLADADIGAGMELRAALAHDDRAGADGLSAVRLHAQHLRLRIAAVAGRAAALLLCPVGGSCLLALAGHELAGQLVERVPVAGSGELRLLGPSRRIVRREARAARLHQRAQALDRGLGQLREGRDPGLGEDDGDLRSDTLDLLDVVARGCRDRRHFGAGFADCRRDAADEQLGEVLPVALLLSIVLAAAHLEDADLVVTTVGQDRCRNRGARYERSADGELVARADRQ